MWYRLDILNYGAQDHKLPPFVCVYDACRGRLLTFALEIAGMFPDLHCAMCSVIVKGHMYAGGMLFPKANSQRALLNEKYG